MFQFARVVYLLSLGPRLKVVAASRLPHIVIDLVEALFLVLLHFLDLIVDSSQLGLKFDRPKLICVGIRFEYISTVLNQSLVFSSRASLPDTALV